MREVHLQSRSSCQSDEELSHSAHRNILNHIYYIKSLDFSIIFEALKPTDTELQLCFSKYVR